MNKRSKPFDFHQEIRAQISAWHSIRRELEDVLKEDLSDAEAWARKHPALGIDYLFHTLTWRRRLRRRLLWSRFGYKVPRIWPYPLEGRFVKLERLPRNDKEVTLLRRTWCALAAEEASFYSMSRVVQDAPRVDKDTFRTVCREFKRSVLEPTTLDVELLLRKSYEDQRLDERIKDEQLIAELSSWVGAQISLKHHKRLEHALKETNKSAFSALLQELPGATLHELDRLVREGVPPDKLRNRVVEHLANVESTWAKLNRLGERPTSDLSNISADDWLLEDFLAREALAGDRVAGKISEREYQVLEQTRREDSGPEIASDLEVTG